MDHNPYDTLAKQLRFDRNLEYKGAVIWGIGLNAVAFLAGTLGAPPAGQVVAHVLFTILPILGAIGARLDYAPKIKYMETLSAIENEEGGWTAQADSYVNIWSEGEHTE